MPFWCWTDEFFYHQCCDTETYGASGLSLCFQAQLTFERCCPPPDFGDLLNVSLQRDVHDSPWRSSSKIGCDAELYWVPSLIARHLSDRNHYHPKSGDVLPTTDKPNLAMLEKQLYESNDFSLRKFVRDAMQYYITGELGIVMAQVQASILNYLPFVLQECPRAAFLAGFLKAEELFHRDKEAASELKRMMTKLLHRSLEKRRISTLEDWLGDHALARLSALERVPKPAQRITVDLVVPLCSNLEIASLVSSLDASLSSLQEVVHFPPETLRAALRLHVYDTCGLVLGKDVLQTNSSDILTHLIFSQLPDRVRFCFGRSTIVGDAPGLPFVRVVEIEEDVPTGDVSAYLHHLALIASHTQHADVILLLHPDFAEHIRIPLLHHVFGSLLSGAWPKDDVNFLYLGWRHEGPVDGRRVASTLQPRCTFEHGQIKHCIGSPSQPLSRSLSRFDFNGFNPMLLANVWQLIFGRPLNPILDDFGGYDFSQLLLSHRAASSRPPSFWRYLSHILSSSSSFRLLPGTRFISTRVDLTPAHGFNKGVSIWLEHMWHLLFDPRFHPEKANESILERQRFGLKGFTRLGDTSLPLFLRVGPSGPDNMMLEHYWLAAEKRNA